MCRPKYKFAEFSFRRSTLQQAVWGRVVGRLYNPSNERSPLNLASMGSNPSTVPKVSGHNFPVGVGGRSSMFPIFLFQTLEPAACKVFMCAGGK